MNVSFGSYVPAFQASMLLVISTTRSRAWPGVYTFQTDGPWGETSIMAQNPLQTALPSVWIGPSALLNRVIVSVPGALPQADMVRAFGAFRSDQNCNLRSLWRAEGPIYTSLGQRPRKRSDRKKNKG